MAIVTKLGILGTVQGKVGNLVVVKWKDKTIVRKQPRKRRTKPLAAEKRNWSNFSMLHYWLRPIIIFLRAGYNGYPGTTHAFNAAKSQALKNAFEGKPKVFNPALLQVSWGDLPLPANISVEKNTDRELVFSWNPAGPAYQQYDQAMLLAYDNETSCDEYKLTGQFRSAGSDKLKLVEKGRYHVYIAFVAADRSRQSPSQYLGWLEID